MAAFDTSPSSFTRPAAAGRSVPLLAFLVMLAVLPLLLSVTIPQPIGPMFWDHYIYLDATNRIATGQVPNVDFFTPVGPLGYYLFYGLISAFPEGHPLLLSSWALLLVSAPLMALVVRDVQARSAALAVALAVPFLFYSILPFNSGDFYPYPGSDGFGIYNRQICQLLYVLAAGLLFVEQRSMRTAIVVLTMLALLFIKVTGVAAGTLLCLAAFATGRLPLRHALVAGILFFATIALLELSTGIPSAYLADILALLTVNDGSLLPRLLQAASLNFGVVFFAVVLAVVLLVADIPEIRARFADLVRRRRLSDLSRLLDRPALWLGAFLAAGILFESQNTGSQAFIFLWPLLLGIVLDQWRRRGARPLTIAVFALALAAALPPLVTVTQKAGRAWIGAVNNQPIESHNLKTMGATSVRPLIQLRADRLEQNYVTHRDSYEDLTHSGELHSFLLFSDFDFQVIWLTALDKAIDAIRAYESAKGVHFRTIMNIDFTNPVPWLMEREAPKYIAIGADPFRAVPPPTPQVAGAVGAVDLALLPTCPPATSRQKLLDLYQPMLKKNHTRIRLTDCFDAFVRSDLAQAGR
ncbi:hypothetical protein [Ensifer soli]|uniref:hypothetical protein n=1 Tax=Ciceribacter sp. sgz301302 TaxID=3342379 RepID=UPI0035BB8C40